MAVSCLSLPVCAGLFNLKHNKFMKKNEAWCLFWKKRRLKTLLIMKFLALFLVVSTFQLSAKVYSQIAKVTLNLERVSFDRLAKELEAATGYTFLYREAQVEQLNDLSVKCKKEDLNKVLDECLKGTHLTYRLVDRTIVIVPATESRTVTEEVRRKVEGVVRDEKGEPLPGVAVMLEGTTFGVATDGRGKYALEFADTKEAVLVFSFIGMKSQRIPVAGRTVIDVKMESEQQQIDEVVVVAYGTRKKGTIAGSVSTVKSEKLANVPAAGFDQALQGQSPGLTVLASSGEPSKPSTFQIRGTNSINSGTSPLFILDGVPISNTDFNTISPNDIESVTVLKDASSTSIYGARAANGVVVITTKRGRMAEAARVTLRTQLGFSQLANNENWDLMNTAERIQYEKEVGLDEGQNYDRLSRTDINWLDMVYNDKAFLQNYEVSVSGATDKVNYFVSGGFYDQDGIAVGSTFERYNLRANVEARASKWLKLGTNSMLAYENVQQSDDGEYAVWAPISAAQFMLPYWNPYQKDGSLASQDDNSWKGTGQNPLEWMENNPLTNKKYKAITTLFAEVSLVEGLTIRSQVGIDYSHVTSLYRSFPSYKPNNNSGFAKRTSYDALNLTITNTVNYRLTSHEVHDFNFMLGQEGVDYHYEGFDIATRGQTNDFLTNVTAGTSASSWHDTPANDYSYLSFFARGEYNYDSRYYFDFSVRADGSSRFGSNDRWGAFWSVGAMWDIRKEKFMEKYAWLSNAQLTVSTGTSGNSSINNYDHLALVAGGLTYDGNAGIAIAQQGNEKLGWEQTWTTNVGLHLGFIQRFNLDVEFYNKNTSDMLMKVPVSYAEQGFGTKWDNVGAMVNRGVEMMLNADVVRIKDFTWNVNANVSYNKNKITELYNGIDEYVDGNTGRKMMVGHPVGEFFLNRYAGVNPANGDALWYTKDGELTTEYSEDDKVMMGKTYIAPWQGGCGTTLSWKGLSLNAQFSWVKDRWMMNNDRYFSESGGLFDAYNQSRRMLYDRWKNPGDVTDIPRHGVSPQMDSRILEDASFLRLKNVMLSYALPQKWMDRTNFLSSVRVYLQGQNLLTFTKFSGLDPESSSNLYKAQYPMSRQFSCGVEVSF